MRTLVLNKAYIPIKIISAHAAVMKLYSERATVVTSYENILQEFNWDKWVDFSMNTEWPAETNFFRAQHIFVAVPKVIRVIHYSKIPKATVKLSRKVIYDRDDHRCYICGKHFHEDELTLDHIIPVSKKGLRTWSNLITCCKPCNSKKGDKLLSELNIKPKFLATAPQISNMQKLKFDAGQSCPEWAYWGI